ncbi:hypothetical protein BD413DRAFT_542480 [Trametes elegans]|nr:hypothetical protein BD413DRAFT_542441 [Trametes elegans]KAI0772840.1 hypothetical protein BD413DRAFT_542480 [Trametes elegans]
MRQEYYEHLSCHLMDAVMGKIRDSVRCHGPKSGFLCDEASTLSLTRITTGEQCVFARLCVAADRYRGERQIRDSAICALCICSMHQCAVRQMICKCVPYTTQCSPAAHIPSGPSALRGADANAFLGDCRRLEPPNATGSITLVESTTGIRPTVNALYSETSRTMQAFSE